MSLPYCKRPCAECPWRLDAKPGKFPASRYIELATTAYDMAATLFACHMTPGAGSKVCAGYILMQGAHNLRLRMERKRFDVRGEPQALFSNYRRMAIANGVPNNHPALRNCRDDGQTSR